MRRIGEVLLQRGLVTEADLDQANAARAAHGGFIEPALVRLGAVSESDLLRALADELRLDVLDGADLPNAEAIRAAAARLNTPIAWLVEKEAVLWFREEAEGERLCIAGRHVHHPALQEAAEQWGGGEARLFLADSQTLQPLLAELSAPAVAPALVTDAARLREMAEGAPVIDFVTAMLAEAIARRASDVHVEPFEDHMSVRLRVDGVLSEWRRAPRALYDAVASRLKLLSGMDIAERRLPQDGRQSLRVSGQDHDVRVSSLPTTWGESIVLRFLGKTRTLPEFAALGLEPDYAALVLRLIEKPNGLVLVTGPTGSGKTTTVYRMLTHLNDGVRKIFTIEDPVEIDLPRVLQMHVRADIGLSFATGLRSILRQDPDVIMVGEIRDGETARIAVQAALTGHLVISTVHTNSALAAIARLLDLGVEEFLLADVLRGVIGQRLVRMVCESCARPDGDAGHEAMAESILPPALREQAPAWRVGTGCPRCARSGFVGRVGVFEAAEIDPPLQQAIRARAAEAEFERLARMRGFRTMYEDGVWKARRGVTSYREALRVLGG